LTSPNQNIGGDVPGIPGGVDASEVSVQITHYTQSIIVSRTVQLITVHSFDENGVVNVLAQL